MGTSVCERSTGALGQNKTSLIPSYVVNSKVPLTPPRCIEGYSGGGMNLRIRGASGGRAWPVYRLTPLGGC